MSNTQPARTQSWHHACSLLVIVMASITNSAWRAWSWWPLAFASVPMALSRLQTTLAASCPRQRCNAQTCCALFPQNTTNATTRLSPPPLQCQTGWLPSGQPGHCCPPGFEVDAETGQCTLPKTECKNGLVNIAPGVCECPSGFKEYSSNDGAGCELPMSEVHGRPCRSQRHTRKS